MSALTTTAIEKVNYTHDAMIDILIANPAVTQRELAAHFGYTEGWVSRIIRADSFREAVAARKKELTDPILLQTFETRFEALVSQSLEILQQQLQASPSFDKALKAADLGARALGYGAKQQGATMNVQFVVHTPPKAATTEEWLEGRVVNG